MTRHDDREWVPAKRRADATGAVREPDRPRDLTIRGGRSRRDRPGRCIYFAPERIDPAIVEGNVAQVTALAGKMAAIPSIATRTKSGTSIPSPSGRSSRVNRLGSSTPAIPIALQRTAQTPSSVSNRAIGRSVFMTLRTHATHRPLHGLAGRDAVRRLEGLTLWSRTVEPRIGPR
jgi:hypothetical protein